MTDGASGSLPSEYRREAPKDTTQVPGETGLVVRPDYAAPARRSR
jgi:hypothetical protein